MGKYDLAPFDYFKDMAERLFDWRRFETSLSPWFGVHYPSSYTENENEYKVELDVPGLDAEDISIEVSDGYLTVESKKEDENSKRYYKYKGYFPDINAEKIEATLDKGILMLILPKREEKKTKTIEIKGK